MNKSQPSVQVRILLLEDDFTLSEILEEFLREIGYDVVCAYDGESAIDLGYEKPFDLFLLDVKVPLANGFDVLAELRKNHKTAPAMFITSLGSLDDLSRAYEAGCDDYLKKPFELKELEFRIKALLKRTSSGSAAALRRIGEDIIFDPVNGVLHVRGETFPLPRKESLLLKTLLDAPIRLHSSQSLLDAAWDYDEGASEETLRTHIKNLRKLLGKERIVNIRAQGYKIVLS